MENGTFSIKRPYKVKVATGKLQALLVEDESVDVTKTPQKDSKWVLIRESQGEKPIGKIKVHFHNAKKGIDLSKLTANIDVKTRKAIIHMDSWPEEIEQSKVLYIPSTGMDSFTSAPVPHRLMK